MANKENVKVKKITGTVGTTRRKAFRTVTIMSIVVLVLVMVGFNILINVLDDQLNMHVDMSQQKYYSISDTTKQLLDGLDQDIYIYTLYTTGNEDTRVTELLRNYASYSDRIHVENVDLTLNPGFTAEFDPQGEGISASSMIVTNEAHSLYKVYSVFELYSIDPSSTYVYAFNAESRVSSAIVYLQTGLSYKIKLLSGHNEYTKADLNGLVVSLNALNYEVESYDSTTSTEALDPQYDLLMVVSPSEDLSDSEYDTIKAFLDKGGNAVFMLHYVVFDSSTGYTQIIMDPLNNFNALLMKYGLSVNQDYIIGGNANKLYKRVTGHIPTMNSHEITDDLIKNDMTPVLMDCSSIKIESGSTVKASPLLETDKDTWGKAVSTSMSANYEDGDEVGPFVIGAVAQSGDSKIALYSSSSFALSNAEGIERSANEDLIINTVNSLAGNTNNLNIQSKSMMAGIMEFNSDVQSLVLEIIVIAIIPIIIVVVGLVVWFRRKRR
jgi:ABC-2 type transport system permease protein